MMESANFQNDRDKKIESIDHALKLLNDASQTSASEIQDMVHRDYKKLKSLFLNGAVSEGQTLRNEGNGSSEKIARDAEKAIQLSKEAAVEIDKAVHRSPWLFVGATAVATALIAYILGSRRKRL